MDVITSPATEWLLVGRLILATACGAAIGVNRELQRKPAGLRTHALVALGAALGTSVSLALHLPADPFDPAAASRVLQGIVAGIGFIGAGVILHREGGVLGLTTAASVWVVAAIGLTIGAGMWRTGLAGLTLTLGVLIIGEPIDRMLHRRTLGKKEE